MFNWLFAGKKKHEGEEKFSAYHYRDYRKGYGYSDPFKYRGSVYVKVDASNKVIEVGEEIWGKKEQVHFLGLPYLLSSKSRDISITLSKETACWTVRLPGNFTVWFKEEKFSNFQELYDKVTCSGFEHIDDYLRHCVEHAGATCVCVQYAFARYEEEKQHETELLKNLSEAINTQEFKDCLNGLLLGNIEKYELSLILDITGEMTAKHSFV